MIPSESYLGRIADTLVAELLKNDLVDLTGDRATLRERFFAVLRKNFSEDAELERDAEAFANEHRREMIGMDTSKVVALVKQRLAKERGFIL